MDYNAATAAGVHKRGVRTPSVSVTEVSASSSTSRRPSMDEAAMWQMSIRETESMESGPYPERPGEPDCTYYLRTGLCRYGMTCRYNHPLNRQMVIATASIKGGYPERVGHPECQQSYPGGLTNWPLSRASFIASPRWQGLSSYGQVIVPQGLVQVPSWNTFPGQLGAVSSSDTPLLLPRRTTPFYGASCQSETVAGVQGTVPSYQLNTLPMGQYVTARDNVFPERPDQSECQFYMKTGDCKFGAACKFHHPRERIVPPPNCMLNPLGLPLRPGEPLCIFYSRYGICKFGAHCKFNHPMATPMELYAYSLSPTSLVDISMERNFFDSSSSPTSLEVTLEAATGKSRRLSLAES